MLWKGVGKEAQICHAAKAPDTCLYFWKCQAIVLFVPSCVLSLSLSLSLSLPLSLLLCATVPNPMCCNARPIVEDCNQSSLRLGKQHLHCCPRLALCRSLLTSWFAKRIFVYAPAEASSCKVGHAWASLQLRSQGIRVLQRMHKPLIQSPCISGATSLLYSHHRRALVEPSTT